jgi:hypothetical protein
MKKTLANKLIDKKIDGYINKNRRRAKGSSQGMSIFRGYIEGEHKCHNQTVSQSVEQGRLQSKTA